MFVGSTQLTIRRPSSTTVSFTVSNAHVRNTIAAKVKFYLSIFLRLIIVVSVVVLLGIKWRCSVTYSWESSDVYASSGGTHSGCPLGLKPLTLWPSWQVTIPFSLALLFFSFRRFHTGEHCLKPWYHSSGLYWLPKTSLIAP